jgi:hypothetical protein
MVVSATRPRPACCRSKLTNFNRYWIWMNYRQYLAIDHWRSLSRRIKEERGWESEECVSYIYTSPVSRPWLINEPD